MILTQERQSGGKNDPLFAGAQVTAWEKTLAVRISMQQIMDQVNTFPVLPDSFVDDSELINSELHVQLQKTLNGLVDILDSQCDRNRKVSRKRQPIKSSEDWKSVVEPQELLQPQWESVVNKWHARTHFGSEEKKANLKIFNQTIWDQIDKNLSDTNRIIEKSSMPARDSKRRRLSVLVDHTQDADSEIEYDTEVYDDRQFYSMLLKSFIASSTSAGGGSGSIRMRPEDLAALRSFKRSKSKVDRKASKGRKIKYVAHEKLANFMFPTPSSHEDGSFDADRLYQSLFQ